jgi:hypothetical protein
MKRFYSTAILLGIFVTGAFAQRRCDIRLVAAAPATNTTVNCKDSFTLAYIFVNNGPDMVLSTDTLYVQDGESLDSNSYWFFKMTANKGVGDTVITYIGKSHKNMTKTLVNSTGTAYVNAPFANGEYKYPIIFAGFQDSLAVKDTSSGNNAAFPKFTINCTTGIDELTGGLPKSSLNIYPNPAATEVRMKHTFVNENATVRVTDVTGRVLLTKDYGKQSTGEKELSLDISSLQNGIFYIELITDERRAINKFTVRK